MLYHDSSTLSIIFICTTIILFALGNAKPVLQIKSMDVSTMGRKKTIEKQHDESGFLVGVKVEHYFTNSDSTPRSSIWLDSSGTGRLITANNGFGFCITSNEGFVTILEPNSLRDQKIIQDNPKPPTNPEKEPRAANLRDIDRTANLAIGTSILLFAPDSRFTGPQLIKAVYGRLRKNSINLIQFVASIQGSYVLLEVVDSSRAVPNTSVEAQSSTSWSDSSPESNELYISETDEETNSNSNNYDESLWERVVIVRRQRTLPEIPDRNDLDE